MEVVEVPVAYVNGLVCVGEAGFGVGLDGLEQAEAAPFTANDSGRPWTSTSVPRRR